GCINKFRHKRRRLTIDGWTPWQTSSMRVVLKIVLEPFSQQSSRPRQSLRFFRIQVSIGEPYPGEVGFTVMRPRHWLRRYHGAFADRCRNRARIVPKRIQGVTFSEPDVELQCVARLYRNVAFHEWLERAARHAEGNIICS